ncbi:hypothetical protein Q0590_19040 [Rhodocytophaga aerolata]|uniref:Uncharacterized protein n=1 Tax=Rhodocytophaga aerolata TaxID=455078 RepID=A0ABT8R8F1_9BACT|nr:hypothetical protein [Rhodocytophaga aerolata]MDO1448380.1 hypothetical protein [Rhodocytophaga aerolata]
MPLLLKIIFCLAASINGLVTLFYLGMTVLSFIYPPAPHYRSLSGVIFVLGCLGVIGLLGWAYQLLLLQGKTGAGFGVLCLSYFLWLPILVAMIFTGNGNWQ